MTDENLWLEEIHGEAPLEWAAEQSAATLARFASPAFDALSGRLLEVIDSDDRIPIVSRRGAHYYNFWRDREHPRGLWRRTTLESYRSADTDWELLLDVDELGRREGAEWVFSGATLLPRDYTRALVALSPDGGDAVTVREFDLPSRSFVPDGFIVPTAKSEYCWIDHDTIYLGTDFGPGSMTESSYPRTVRRLRRGQPLADATLVHEVAVGDLAVAGVHHHTPGFERDLIVEHLDFYRSRTFLVVDGELVPLEVPDDADLSLRREWLLVHPRSDWRIGGVVHPTGALIAIRLDAFLAGDRDFDVLFMPDAHTALEEWDFTDSHLILTLLVDVASTLVVLDPSNGWSRSSLAGLPALSTVRVIDTDPDESEDFGVPWTDPRALNEFGAREATKPWTWAGPNTVAEGPTWGGCIEVIDQIALADRMPEVTELAGAILLLETSEELPAADDVKRWVRALGERGILASVAGVLVARPPVSGLHSAVPSSDERARLRVVQCDTIIEQVTRYNPDAVVCVGLPFGHTRPQWIIPHGGTVRLDGTARRVSADYS